MPPTCAEMRDTTVMDGTEKGTTAMRVNQTHDADDAASVWKMAAAIVLDVRPELEQGGEPFVQIMEAAQRIQPGESLVIVAPFEPAPLYSALGGRGFSHAAERVTSDEWIVQFTRNQ